MTDRNVLFVLVFFIGLSLPAGALAEGDFNNELSKARSFVEQKSYGKALKMYAGISEGLRKDPGLVIEWARVYTYADDHEEAIKLFEEVRSAHPECSAEILRELADQYKWSGNISHAVEIYKKNLELNADDPQAYMGLADAFFSSDQKSEALQIYKEALERWPDNTDAILGKANILSYQDKLEESYALYQTVLDKDPGNLNALNSQARILVWQGYYRQGISRYEEILKRYPKDPDAIEGMAFALHWLGDDGLAVDRLNELFEFAPDRKEAQELYSKIKNSQHPFIKPSGHITNDSTPQTVVTGGVRSGLHLNYSTSIDGIYDHWVLHKDGSSAKNLSADRGGLGLSKSFSDIYEFNVFLYGTHFDKIDFDPLTANTWLTYKPDDYWRIDLAYERETFEDNDALLHKVITDSPSISVDFRLNRFWFFNAKYKRSYFSDDNGQNQFFGTAEYRLFHKPYVKLYYNYYYSDWEEEKVDHGYFNPRSLSSHALGVYTGLDLTRKLFVEAKASGGYEFQDKYDPLHDVSNHPTFYTQTSLNYRLTADWQVSASVDYFTTWPDHGQRSYQKRGAYLSFTYNFGASPAGLRDSSQPFRTTGAR